MMKTVYIITSPSWNEDFIDALSFYYLSNQNGNLTLLNKDKEFVKDGFLNEEVVKYFESTVDYIEDCLIFNDKRLDQETVVNNLIDTLETGSYSSGDFWLTFINEVCDDSYSESFDSVLRDYECKYVLN